MTTGLYVLNATYAKERKRPLQPQTYFHNGPMTRQGHKALSRTEPKGWLSNFLLLENEKIDHCRLLFTPEKNSGKGFAYLQSSTLNKLTRFLRN